jgi:hypothetical protein
MLRSETEKVNQFNKIYFSGRTGYFIGPKLTRTMVVIILGLFTLVTIVMTWHVAGAYSDAAHLALEIAKSQGSADSVIAWMFRGGVPEGGSYLSSMIIGVIVISYLAALVFFFHARHHDVTK